MDCKTFEEQLEAYLANDLSPDGQIEMDQHRASCLQCESSVVQTTQVERLLRQGLPPVAAIKPAERIALRESVLGQIRTRQPTFWQRWIPRLAAVVVTLTIAIVAILATPWRGRTPHVSAAEIVTRSQAVMTDHSELSGVLHLEATIEQWAPGIEEISAHGVEMWFDLDNPVRYRIQYMFNDKLLWAESRTIQGDVGTMWKYSIYPESSAIQTTLSVKEIQQLASWYNPALFRDELPQLAQTVSGIERVGETTVAGRQAHMLRGEILSLGAIGSENTLEPAPSTVTVTVDAETYWLLGWEETVKGESRPRIAYRTERFELLSQSQVSASTFTLDLPEDVGFQQVDGLNGLYGALPYSPMTLEQVADAAAFTLLIPTEPPEGIRAPHYASLRSLPHVARSQEFTCIYRGSNGRWMALYEYTELLGPGFSVRQLDVNGREGWIKHDLIYADAFTIYLLEWDKVPEATSYKPLPGTIMLEVKGYSVSEAIDVLNSLEPYKP